MTDRYENIRRALEMGPTPGPWYVRTNRHTDTDGRQWGWLDAAPPGGGQANIRGIQAAWTRGDRSEANVRFIAACDPDTIWALLDERDALLAERDRLKEALTAMLEIHGVTQRYADAHIEIPQSWVDVSDLARAALAQEQENKA